MKIFRGPSTPFTLAFYFGFGLALLLSQSALAADSGDMVPLNLKLPAPAFKGTPKDIQLSSYVEPLSDKPRPPMMVPAGMINIAAGAKLTCSEKTDTYEFLSKITEDVKEN